MVEEVEVRRRVITLKHNLMEAAGDETPDADAPATGTNGETHGTAPQLPWEISLPAIGNGHSESTACVVPNRALELTLRRPLCFWVSDLCRPRRPPAFLSQPEALLDGLVCAARLGSRPAGENLAGKGGRGFLD